MDLQKLEKTELIRRLRDSYLTLSADRRMEKRLLHDLQVHQIELELQNRELRETQQELETSRDRYADLYDFAPVGYLTLDQKGMIIEANLTATTLLGVPRKELVGRPLGSHIAKQSKTPFYHHLKQSHQSRGKPVVTELTLQCQGETPRQVRLESVAGNPDNRNSLHTVMVDISERVRAEEQLRLANSVLESTPEGIMITDAEQNIVMVNPAFTAITGFTAAEAIGKKPDMLKSGLQDQAFYQGIWKHLETEDKWEAEIWNRRKNGEIYPEWLILSEIRNTAGQLTNYVGMFSDITTQARIRERLHRLAYYDPLTELPNREQLYDKFDTLRPLAKRQHDLLAILFLDLDHFKQVNDTLGHLAGDELLMETAYRLCKCIRETDIVVRLGGDEFIVLLTNLQFQAEVEMVAGKIINIFETPFVLQGTEFYVTASIGISICPRDGEDITTLIKHADTAMYNAKESGRNNFQFFRVSLTEAAKQRVLLSSHLHRAIENGQLQLCYQPQLSIQKGQVVGVEALVRWNHPLFGPVPPEKFIAVAEETGYILTLSEWITTQAIAEWRSHFKALLPEHAPRLCVNVSSVQFHQQNLYTWIEGLLERSGVQARHLELEITESVLIQDTAKASRVLTDLDRLGVRIAIDDFGTGYSSLSYLSKFPIHAVKIDRSFIHDMTRNEKQLRLIRAIIRMGQDMDYDVVAEGVETTAQLALLRELGCDLIQGLIYSCPKTAEDLAQWIRLRDGKHTLPTP